MARLSDILSEVNDLSMSMQDRDQSLTGFSDEINGFKEKLKLPLSRRHTKYHREAFGKAVNRIRSLHLTRRHCEI